MFAVYIALLRQASREEGKLVEDIVGILRAADAGHCEEPEEVPHRPAPSQHDLAVLELRHRPKPSTTRMQFSNFDTTSSLSSPTAAASCTRSSGPLVSESDMTFLDELMATAVYGDEDDWMFEELAFEKDNGPAATAQPFFSNSIETTISSDVVARSASFTSVDGASDCSDAGVVGRGKRKPPSPTSTRKASSHNEAGTGDAGDESSQAFIKRMVEISGGEGQLVAQSLHTSPTGCRNTDQQKVVRAARVPAEPKKNAKAKL